MSFFRRAGSNILRVIKQALDPAAEADRILVYGKDIAGLTQLFARLSDGTVTQLSPANFAPARVLFVAQSWPAGADPTRYFASIAAAETAAAALVPAPSSANPVCLYIFPGTYADPVVLTSNVHIFGGAHRDVIISGAVSWTPGAGVNAPQTANSEEIFASSIRITGTLSVDATGKGGSVSVLDLWRCSLTTSAVTVLSRAAGGQDFFQAYHTNISPPAGATFSNTFFNAADCAFRSMTFTGIASAEIDSFQSFGTMTFNTPGIQSRVSAVQFLAGSVVVTAGDIDFTACKFNPGVTVTVAAGANADLRMAEYSQNANLAGAGTINRSIWRTTVGPTVIGANVVPIAPPLPDANYDVSVELTAAGAMPFVSAKAGANFTINDAVGGNTYNLTVLKE